jgi:hypothetical protein
LRLDGILKPSSGVIEREIAHLPVDASSVERDRPGSGSEGAQDCADRLVVASRPAMGEDGLLPRLVAPYQASGRRLRRSCEARLHAVRGHSELEVDGVALPAIL